MNESRDVFEWGLASSLLGAVMSSTGLMAMPWPPPFLSFTIPFLATVPGIDRSVLVIPAVVQLAAFAGAAFGCRAVLIARRSRRPIALGLSGVMLCVIAILTWAVVGLSWYGYLTNNGMMGGMGAPNAFFSET